MVIFTRCRYSLAVVMDGIVKRYSPACDKNKQAILDALKPFLVEKSNNKPWRLLEIGSGTGQHAVFFAEHLPYVEWQPSDVHGRLASIDAWQKEAKLANLLPPITLNVDANSWSVKTIHHMFTANTAHIISIDQLQRLFEGAAKYLPSSGYFFIYGPFNYDGQFTSDSNAAFDLWLKNRDSQSGIRDIEMLNSLANQNSQFNLVEDIAMPANNRLLVFKKN